MGSTTQLDRRASPHISLYSLGAGPAALGSRILTTTCLRETRLCHKHQRPAMLALQPVQAQDQHQDSASSSSRPAVPSCFPALRSAVAGRQAGAASKCLRSMRQLACRVLPLLTQLTSLELTGLDAALNEGDLQHFTVRACFGVALPAAVWLPAAERAPRDCARPSAAELPGHPQRLPMHTPAVTRAARIIQPARPSSNDQAD